MRKVTEILSNKRIKEEFGIDMQQTLHLIREHDLVGAIMAQAVKRGEFDNLEGTGKPINLEENPYEPSELRLAHKILKDNGFAPYWIELGKEIDALKVEFNKEVDYFKRYIRMIFIKKRNNVTLHHFEQKKNDFYTQSRERLVEISKKIFDYNLRCPVSTLGRCNFNVDNEMNQIIKDTEKIIEDLKGSL